MNYRVRLSKQAVKQFRKLPTRIQDQIYERLSLLAHDPFAGDVEKLRGERNRFRLRSGRYRAIYEVAHTSKVISVLDIGHRKDVYRP